MPPGAQVLLDAGFVTVCAGGGGVPVAVEEVADGRVQRRRHGIEAVIDKARPLPGPVCQGCTCIGSSAACPLSRSCISQNHNRATPFPLTWCCQCMRW
jgi:hypothetical protein